MMTPTRTDMFGQLTSMAPSGDLAAWDATQKGFLAHAAMTPDALAQAMASDADFALAHAAKGLFCGLLGRREMRPVAQQAERDARFALTRRPVTSRERVFVDALGDWNAGQPSRAAARLDAHLEGNPGDALAMKLVQSIRFMLGDAGGMRASIERVLPAYHEHHPAHGFAQGCHAFALEETGEYDRAERIGRKGVDMEPTDAWGLHAVAHVYDMTANSRKGIEWVSGNRHAWDHCNNFRYHVWWHLALMHLDRNEIDAVLTLYDDHIRADRTDDYRDISNAASLLSRLEVDGHSVGDRWEELANLCENRTQDGCVPFADLHYMLSLVGGNRSEASARLISRMRQDAEAERTEMARIYAHPGIDAAEGMEAFGEGDFDRAFTHLAGAHGAMQTVGGSHAQRDVFERLTIEAGIRAGCHETVRGLLDARTAQRGGNLDRFAHERYEQIDNAAAIAAQ